MGNVRPSQPLARPGRGDSRLRSIVKAYDIRGIVPDQLDEELAETLGRAVALELAGDAVVVARDMRPSSPGLAGAFVRGIRRQGVDTIDAGLGSTDLLYYASGSLGVPGAMFTASHNPARYNGIKLCRAGAEPVSMDTGLSRIRDLAEAHTFPEAAHEGSATDVDVLAGYAAHVRSFVDVPALRPLKVAVDAGNGMAGHVVPAVFEGLPFEVVPLFFELDGTFPNHPADPLEPDNLVDLQRAVVEHGCHVGLAFDGDADRVFVIDESGDPVSPSVVTALIADVLLRKEPGATVLYNLVCSKVVPETIRAAGGWPVRTRVGHSFIKARMAETGAMFAGEHSGHYYFRDNYRADSGTIAALLLLEALSSSGGSLSALAAPYERYAATGEINVVVENPVAAQERLVAVFGGTAAVDRTDGLTLDGGHWWVNLRASNTEPVLRLNAEADDSASVECLRDRVLEVVRG